MPYSRKRYGGSRRYGTRKATRTSRKGTSRRASRRGKYAKVSRKRPTWTSGTVISPYRKFTYNDQDFTIQLTNLSPVSWNRFRGNSLYDPDYDGAGAQPYGFDQLCPAFYQRYCVKSSKITVYPYLSMDNTLTPQRIRFIVVPFTSVTMTSVNYNDVLALPGARAANMSWYSNDTKPLKISAYTKTSRVLGKNKASDADSTALYNASPINQWWWSVYAYSGDTLSAEVNIRYDVKIKYYTILSEKVEILQS